MSHLRLRSLTKRFDDVTAVDAVDLDVEEGETVVLLGPSGCGKTTCLRLIAGFERPDAGSVELGGRTLVEGRTFVPPERRRMSVVFQSYALWPHMTVADNVGYGPTVGKEGSQQEIAVRVAEALELVRLGGLEHRYPHQLSGGQQQRVALARALVTRPTMLLLDEPLSNLDTRLREEMRFEIKRIQRELGITMVYVTHDQAEALSLADRVVVMHAGRIAQAGPPEEIYRRPRNRYVAGALGATNVLGARVLSCDGVRTVVRLPGDITVEAATPAGHTDGAAVLVSIRPSDIDLIEADDAHAHGHVTESLFFGDSVQYAVELTGVATPLRVAGPGTRRLSVGAAVRMQVRDGTAAVLADAPDASAPAVPSPIPTPTGEPTS